MLVSRLSSPFSLAINSPYTISRILPSSSFFLPIDLPNIFSDRPEPSQGSIFAIVENVQRAQPFLPMIRFAEYFF